MSSEARRGRGGTTRQPTCSTGFIRNIVNHSNSLYRRRRDRQRGSEIAACSGLLQFLQDSVIIQRSVRQITLGSVTEPRIRFTALYIQLLREVKDSVPVDNRVTGI